MRSVLMNALEGCISMQFRMDIRVKQRPAAVVMEMMLCLLVLLCCCGTINTSRFDPSKVKPLGDPPKVAMNSTEILTYYGHSSKVYEVETEDGYIIPILRMGNKTGPPVLMLNGMGTAPGVWLVFGSHHGLAYVLLDLGYDVWFPGKRGVSLKHKTLKWTKPEFWDFSHDEHGMYDLPPQIDLIMNVTGHKKLLYVGASHGGSIFMSMCSLRPEYCDKFAADVQIVPAMYMPTPADLSPDAKKSRTMTNTFLGFCKLTRMPYITIDPKAFLKANICAPPFKKLCDTGLYLFAAILPDHFYPQEWINFLIPTIGGGLPVKQIEHYSQMSTTGGTPMFDYGTEGNMERYRQATPPHHNLSMITPPTLIIYSQKDYFVPTHIQKKAAELIGKNAILYPVSNPNYGHITSVVGRNIYKLYFQRVVDFFDDVTGYPWN